MSPSPQTAIVIAHVLDAAGQPVAGATVQRVGYRLKEDLASAYSVPEGDLWPAPAPQPTDEAGKTTLAYPVEGEEEMQLAVLFVVVTHPDFCRMQIELPLENPTPLVLQRGSTLTIVGGSETKPLRVLADIGTAASPPDLDWVRQTANTVTAHLPSGHYSVRGIGIDSHDNIWFSTPQTFRAENQVATLHFDLKPGRAVTGQLDPTVPRPIHHGAAIAEVVTESPAGKNFWQTSAPIAEDGSFTLKSIPLGELALIVLCDGFISVPTEASEGQSWKPQVFPADAPSPIQPQMTPTGTARIQVLGPDHLPLSGATVLFSPNQQFHDGNTLLGTCRSTAQALEHGEPLAYGQTNRYQIQTDASGIALVPNLPPGRQIFYVHHADYEMPIAFVQSYPLRDVRIEIIAGTVIDQTVTMEKSGTSSLVREIEKYEELLQQNR